MLNKRIILFSCVSVSTCADHPYCELQAITSDTCTRYEDVAQNCPRSCGRWCCVDQDECKEMDITVELCTFSAELKKDCPRRCKVCDPG